ncbi:MAG: lysophospholipid acyltransferase family protein [Planctomycetota bacterium]
MQRSAFGWWLSRSIVWLFCKVWHRVRHEGSIPETGPLLLVANHTSYLDPILVGTGVRRWVAFLAQAGLASFGPLRWWLAQMGVTLIDRKAPSKDALRLIADQLANGEAVGIFPEGTRSADGKVAPFRSGVEFLVRRTGAAVVPIGLDGAFRAFGRGKGWPRPRKIVVRYGEVWPAERVLAPGGVEALRARVAALANAELGECPSSSLAAGVATAPPAPTSSADSRA